MLVLWVLMVWFCFECFGCLCGVYGICFVVLLFFSCLFGVMLLDFNEPVYWVVFAWIGLCYYLLMGVVFGGFCSLDLDELVLWIDLDFDACWVLVGGLGWCGCLVNCTLVRCFGLCDVCCGCWVLLGWRCCLRCFAVCAGCC